MAPTKASSAKLRSELTFRGNTGEGRHGWLRLTPAYSVNMVREILAAAETEGPVLDPFGGTGTTALLCAEQGIEADATDINPFLVWLTEVKTRSYTASALRRMTDLAERVARVVSRPSGGAAWAPPMQNLERWWDASTLVALGCARSALEGLEEVEPRPVLDLLKVAFCRTMMDVASVSFGHQSMSFQGKRAKQLELPLAGERTLSAWKRSVEIVAQGAARPVPGKARAMLADARELGAVLGVERYSCVITSPPYSNRMSYVRELRPYLYWLGYLKDGRGAGELDWRCIGGTWGIATSLVGKWKPERGSRVVYPGFGESLERIAERSDTLSRYVHKYCDDMARHVESLYGVVRRGGTIHYVVGNSKFYDELVPVERILAAQLENAGFESVAVRTVRKRTSKKELYEYVVSAKKPASRTRRA